MTAKDWSLSQLKAELNARPEIKGWIVVRENVHRRERYFMKETSTLVTDQDREVASQGIEARIIVRLKDPARQGEIVKKLFPSMPLAPQVDAAVAAASQTSHQAWELPEKLTAEVPALATTDPKMAEDLEGTLTALTAQLKAAASKQRSTEFNSAELFLSVHDRELHLSNGLVQRSSQSRVYTEAAFSFARKDARGEMRSDEYMTTRWSVNSADLRLESLFDQAADCAAHSLDTQKPVTGAYPVIVDAEVLATLFNNAASLLSAGNAYQGLPFVKPGEPLVPGATGDLLTISLDPHLAFGADTVGVSDQGLAQGPLKLVDRGIVRATATDKRHADYLGTRPSTSRGNVVVEAGTLSHAELTRAAPRVLEILQFSGLFADANSGTFSSEIRLAKLYEGDRVTYIKGGSLSGSFKDNFKDARLGRERVHHAHFASGGSTGQGYYGPEYALLSDVSVVG